MKTVPAVAVVAALLVVAGCGSGRKTPGSTVVTLATGSLMVAGTTTISNVKAGTVIACKGAGPMGGKGPTTTVTQGQMDIAESSQSIGGGPSSKRNLELARLQNGTLRVSCTR
jgi:hypothetical protein